MPKDDQFLPVFSLVWCVPSSSSQKSLRQLLPHLAALAARGPVEVDLVVRWHGASQAHGRRGRIEPRSRSLEVDRSSRNSIKNSPTNCPIANIIYAYTLCTYILYIYMSDIRHFLKTLSIHIVYTHIIKPLMCWMFGFRKLGIPLGGSGILPEQMGRRLGFNVLGGVVQMASL